MEKAEKIITEAASKNEKYDDVVGKIKDSIKSQEMGKFINCLDIWIKKLQAGPSVHTGERKIK